MKNNEECEGEGGMENIRDMDEENMKKMRSERYNAEVVLLPEPFKFFLHLLTAHWNRNREIKFRRTKRGLLCLKKSRGAS
jgi:hypothetical protein